jgi:RNA polymerase sigma-70 factor (ECF subfamily)
MTRDATDQDILRRMQGGDQGALAELYDRYAALMNGVALRILQNAPEAEDVVQDAWLQAWNRSSSFDGNRGTVASWLLTIARTRALDRYRSRASRRRTETGFEAEPVTPPATPDEHAALGHLSEKLSGALAKLDEKQRQVLEIAYFEGLS